jgi:hypothetical protein
VACGATHPKGAGVLDESARRLSHEEVAVARQLVAEGHEVRSVGERPGEARTPDLEVCGGGVEVKTWYRIGAGRDRPPTARSIVNKLLQAEGQAPTVVLYGRGTGLTARTAVAGMAEYACRSVAAGAGIRAGAGVVAGALAGSGGGIRHAGRIGAIRVLGDGFDLGWRRDRTVQQSRRIEPPGLGAGR